MSINILLVKAYCEFKFFYISQKKLHPYVRPLSLLDFKKILPSTFIYEPILIVEGM